MLTVKYEFVDKRSNRVHYGSMTVYEDDKFIAECVAHDTLWESWFTKDLHHQMKVVRVRAVK